MATMATMATLSLRIKGKREFTEALERIKAIGERGMQAVRSMGESFGAALLNVGRYASAINSIKSTFNDLKEAINKSARAKAFFASKMTIVNRALATVKKGFIKLKAVILANPIGAAVVAVAALAGGIYLLISRLRQAGQGYKDLYEDSANWLNRQREIAEASADSAAAFEENTRNMQNNAENLRNYAERLEYLASKQELTAGEMATMEHIMGVLNDSVDGLNLAFDEQTGLLNTNFDALSKYLSAAEKQAALDSQLAERSRLQREAIDIAEEKAQAEQRLLDLQEKQNDGSSRNTRERNLLADAIAYEMEALELLTQSMEANEEMQDALTESIDIYANALEDIRQAQKEAADAIDETSEAMENQIFSIEEWERAQRDALTKIERAFESYKRLTTNAFDTVSENAAISVSDMTRNLQENARAVAEWSQNLALLAERGVDEGLLEQLRQAGPQAAATVRELVSACDEELEILNEAFYDSTVVAVESMQRALDPTGVAQSAEELIDYVATAILTNNSMENALIDTINNAFDSLDSTISTIGFDGLGENTVVGFVDGIDNMLPAVDKAGQDTADTYLGAIKGGFNMNSPSREMQRIGVNAGEGLIRGTRDIQPQVENTARTLAVAFINNVANTINRSQDIDNATRRQVEDIRRIADSTVQAMRFDSVGMEIANGVARGIQQGGGFVSNAATNLINSALSAMRSAAAIQSPSRKTHKIGQQLMDGIAGGLSSKMGELATLCKRITNTITGRLEIAPTVGLGLAPTAFAPNPNPSIEIKMYGTTIREDADIERVASRVIRKISSSVDYEGRFRR